MPLALFGPRSGPNLQALAAAKLLPAAWVHSSEAVAQALVEHLAPYREALAAGEDDPPSQPLPILSQPSDIWASVEPTSVSVVPVGGQLISEVALAATWDDEHTLGARFSKSEFVELNASILPA